eukprot:4288747-Amphidinium_carterae.1
MPRQHCLHTSSTTQVPLTLSSGEAEYYAAVKAGSRLLGLIALMGDLGFKVSGKLNTDSAAAKGVASRRGRGKIRHLEIPTLWLQSAVQRKLFEMAKVHGPDNPADLMTKFLNADVMCRHLKKLGLRVQNSNKGN